MAAFDSLWDPYSKIGPGPFAARYQDWIIFTLLLFFFWAVVGIALKRRFAQTFPLLNGILIIIFMASLFKSIAAFFRI